MTISKGDSREHRLTLEYLVTSAVYFISAFDINTQTILSNEGKRNEYTRLIDKYFILTKSDVFVSLDYLMTDKNLLEKFHKYFD